MPIPQEAMTVEEYQRWDQGLPPVKKKVKPRPEPEEPDVPNRIRFADLPEGEIQAILARPHIYPPITNKEGVVFTGYDLSIRINDCEFMGWMSEADMILLRKRIPRERTDLIQNITF